MQKSRVARDSRVEQGVNISKQAFIAGFNGRYAFTLAEVLITLGIIGVVAAMTLPTIINKTQDKILENQYKKSKSVLANGYKLMMAKKEIFKVENLPIVNDCYEMRRTACMSKEHKEAFNIIADSDKGLDSDLFPKEYAVQGKDYKAPFLWDDVPYMFVTADGMTYGVLPDEDIKSFSVVTDVNGVKNPNTVKKDLYKFRYSGKGLLSDVTSELEENIICSIDNLSGCKTSEACYALDGTARDDGKCARVSWTGNECLIDVWHERYCR